MDCFSHMWREIPFLPSISTYCPRSSPRPGLSTLPSIPEKEAPDAPDEVISDAARSVGGAERSVKRGQPLQNHEAFFGRHERQRRVLFTHESLHKQGAKNLSHSLYRESGAQGDGKLHCYPQDGVNFTSELITLKQNQTALLRCNSHTI